MTTLEERLPHAMAPRRPAALPAIPLTANGKVDRRGLVTAVAASSDRRPGGNTPTRELDPVEQAVARLWESVLDTPVRGPGDNFFTLGGESVKAVRLVERAAAELRVRLPLARFFSRPTVSAFADLARTGRSSAPASPAGMEEGVL